MSQYAMHKWKKFLNETRDVNVNKNKKLVTEATKMAKARKTIASSDEGGKEKTIKLPKLRISEEWGKPQGESDQREMIDIFFSRLPPGDFRSKIEYIEQFISDCSSDVCGSGTSTSDILANLMVLDALSSIIYDFTAQGGGFIFEAFVAALLGGDARQVKAAAGEGIQDIMTQDGDRVSIKFVTGKGDAEGGKVGGSLTNLRSSVGESGEGMHYLVAIKVPGEGDDIAKINFLEFDVGTNGMPVAASSHPDSKFVGLDAQRKTKKRTGVPLIDAEEHLVPKKDFDYDEETGEILSFGKAKPRFSIETPDIINKLKRGNVGFYQLNLGSREELKKIADKYAEQINTDVLDIYDSLDKYGTDLNRYLVQNDMASGKKAIQDARVLKDRTQKIAKEMIKE